MSPGGEGAKALNCPGCGTTVPEGTSICPKCDHIIDDSFLKSPPVPLAAEGLPTSDRTVIAPAPERTDDSHADRHPTLLDQPRAPMPPKLPPRPLRPPEPAENLRPPLGADEHDGFDPPTQLRSVEEIRAEHEAARSAAKAKARSFSRDDVEMLGGPSAPTPTSAPTRPAMRKLAGNPAGGADRQARAPTDLDSPDDLLHHLRVFFGNLNAPDKLVVVGTAVCLVDGFLPWQETRAEGDVLGIFSLGILAVFAAAAALGAVVVRIRPGAPEAARKRAAVVQLAASTFGALWVLLFIQTSWNTSVLPGVPAHLQVPTSLPSLGAYLGLLCLLVSLGGTLMGFRRSSQ